MILPDFKEFPKFGRIIGIDWGARRTGVAVASENREFVFVREPIVSKSADDLIKQIVVLIQKERACGIVIGLPLRIDGTESDTTRNVREFATNLVGRVDLPICFVDEVLSSSAAQESMGRLRVRDIKEKLDSESARVILENAIAMIKRQ